MSTSSTMAVSRLVVFAVLAISVSFATEECVQGVNCHLPECFCPTFSHPMGAKNIPQIVYFAFDDAVTVTVAQYYDKLFTDDRLNPNGCPITMSLFACDAYTDYSLVSEYFGLYDEIGVHSVTHTFIKSGDKLREEASKEKINIEVKANIPGDKIVGWRSPDLITAGDVQPNILKELNFTYDISLPYENPGVLAFPYTLDFGDPYRCSVVPCPKKHSKHPGFWEVPINAHVNPENNNPCCYIDGCRPSSEEAAYKFLMTNFEHAYNGERAPFGLNMHAAWFYFPEYFAATNRFIQTVVDQYPDTYIISVSQMLDWMRNPQNIENSQHFAAWDCPWYKTKQAQKAKLEVVQPPKPMPRPGNSEFVDQNLGLNFLQDYYLRNNVPHPYINKERFQKEKTDLSKFVDSRLGRSSLQNYDLRRKLPHPYLNKDQSKLENVGQSVEATQNGYIKRGGNKSDKAKPIPEKSEQKPVMNSSLLFRTMKRSNYH